MGKTIVKPTTNQSGNGYCKMLDGTLIQWGVVQITTSSSQGSLGYYGSTIIGFSMPFVSSPTIATSPNEHGGYWNSGALSITQSGCTLTLAGNVANMTYGVSWIAIGRWK